MLIARPRVVLLLLLLLLCRLYSARAPSPTRARQVPYGTLLQVGERIVTAEASRAMAIANLFSHPRARLTSIWTNEMPTLASSSSLATLRELWPLTLSPPA